VAELSRLVIPDDLWAELRAEGLLADDGGPGGEEVS
jgi:hypothetical protein